VAGVACKVQAAKYGALMMQSGLPKSDGRPGADIFAMTVLASNHYTRPIRSTPTVGYKYNCELLLVRNPQTLTLNISPQIAPFG
jgi:hypothetical protein